MNRKCLRCDKKSYTCIGESPVQGKWQLFRCDHCSFVWRSTEESYLASHVAKLGEEDMQGIIWPYDPKAK